METNNAQEHTKKGARVKRKGERQDRPGPIFIHHSERDRCHSSAEMHLHDHGSSTYSVWLMCHVDVLLRFVRHARIL